VNTALAASTFRASAGFVESNSGNILCENRSTIASKHPNPTVGFRDSGAEFFSDSGVPRNLLLHTCQQLPYQMLGICDMGIKPDATFFFNSKTNEELQVRAHPPHARYHLLVRRLFKESGVKGRNLDRPQT
jgi:hypothetical protein